MCSKKIVKTDKAPSAIGPYSQAVISNNFIFTAGQIPINPETGRIVDGGFKEQVRQVLENIKAIIEAAGSNIENIVKLTVYLTDLSFFGELNEVFNEYFSDNPPARSAMQVSRLPKEAMIEIDAVVTLK
ncbi:MAG: RidA family protein [Candidatus Marinimicrobia bacterium]|nr:RidA family protein [Candidatus Neomarinimicrobiota bacterium]